jgi:hypothetical protein
MLYEVAYYSDFIYINVYSSVDPKFEINTFSPVHDENFKHQFSCIAKRLS